MNNETLKYLYSFKYNNKEYIYLVSKNYPFYFLEYEQTTKTFEYPDLETFKDLHNKFYSNDKSLALDMKSELKN